MTAIPVAAPVSLRRLSAGDDLGPVSRLMSGYIAEVRRSLLQLHRIDLAELAPDPDLLVDIAGLLRAPHSLYVADFDGQPVATGGLKQIGPGVGEVKRMYVDPAFRRRGVARRIVERILADGRAAGYRALRLESAMWMLEAHALYRSVGFVDSDAFPEREFGAHPLLEPLARYMILPLDES